MTQIDYKTLAGWAKNTGWVFPSSEIYGGWEATYDFGPLAAEVLMTLRQWWWHEFVRSQPDIVGLDSAIISHPRVWEASGHVESFADAMVEDLVTHKRYRADHLIKEQTGINADGLSLQEIDDLIKKHQIKSPEGNPLSPAKYFNQLVEVEIGTTQESKSKAYLRGETCQPIFYNFELVRRSLRLKLPFGVAQIGKAFRNEIKVGPFFFRTREFEQMEIEMFIHPSQADEYYNKFKDWSLRWLASLGINSDRLRLRDQEFKERAHYNKIATDVEYQFPDDWREFQGIHYRGDWDLSRHGQFSGYDFTYTDPSTGEKYIPHVVESSIGLSRLLLVLLMDAYTVEDKRVVLKLHPRLAPYKAAVFPLLANKPDLVKLADQIYRHLLPKFPVAFDRRGNIGKRYLAQDEIGTPWCITVDFDSLSDQTVTVRERDTTQQTRVAIDALDKFLSDKLAWDKLTI